MHPLEAALHEWLEAQAPPGPLAVAHSGGPDSTALAACLVKLGQASRLICLYVDHQDRSAEEMEAERAFVQGCWARWGVQGRILPGPVAVTRRGFEAEARRVRYAALLKAMREAGSRALLVAHTADDVEETLLMRLLRGQRGRSRQGIPPRRGPIHRPLLNLRRESLRAWLVAQGETWFLDSSNTATNLRARIRAKLVPVLDDLFPSWRLALRGLGRLLASAPSLQWRRRGGYWTMARADWEGLHPADRVEALLRTYAGGRPISRAGLLTLALHPRGGKIGGWELRLGAQEIRWGAHVVKREPFQYFLTGEVDGLLDVGSRTLRLKLLPGCPRRFAVVEAQLGDRWETPEGCPDLAHLWRDCLGNRGSHAPVLIAEGRIWGILGSLRGGEDWSYRGNEGPLWEWERHERRE